MVARTLFFAPLLTGLADQIVAGMTAAGVAPFNSLHLRIEKDAKDWATIMGGAGVCLACAVLPMPFGTRLSAFLKRLRTGSGSSVSMCATILSGTVNP